MSDICHLSAIEVGRFQNFGINPNHTHHPHLKFYKALSLLKQDMVCAVDNLPNAVQDQYSNDRVWRGRSSGGAQVMQLVRGT